LRGLSDKQKPAECEQREQHAGDRNPGPATVLVQRARNCGADGAADEDARHVDRVQTVTAVRIELVNFALSEDQVHLHREVEQQAGADEPEHTEARNQHDRQVADRRQC
jgi:hypothetical protein